MAGPEDATVEKFAPNGGQVVAGRRRALVVAAAMIVAWATDPDAGDRSGCRALAPRASRC